MYAYLVCGPEASGNRYLYRLLSTTGLHPCHGLPLDFASTLYPHPPRPCLLVRTLPHAGSFCRLEETLVWLEQAGYAPCLLFPVRDPRIVELSQVRSSHVPDLQTARQHLLQACAHFYHLATTLPAEQVCQFPYHSLSSPAFLAYLQDRCHLPTLPDLSACPFSDGDAQYPP